MADEQEKTFEPTEQKIQDARKKGDIPKSQEINSFSVLFIGTAYLIFGFPFIAEHITKIFKMLFSFNTLIGKDGFNKPNVGMILSDVMLELAYIMLPLMLIILVLAVVGNVSQFGFLLNPVKLELSKLNPISGFKNLLTMKKVVEFVKMLVKFLVLFLILFFILITEKEDIIYIAMYGVDDAISSFLKYVIYIISVVLVIIGVFAIIDLIFIRYNYFKKLMMSIQEVKDEYKNTEGNPEIKQKIKQMQYEMSQRQSMEDTASAKVVITNPDHYAIAIAQEADFENRTFSDPIVVAKGKNENALKIKQIALENKVEIIENKPLARALYKSVEVGQEIPEEFMQIIFDILIQLDYIQTEINKNKK